MTDFAKSQLMKYGWTEGKGLGKNETGITEALKPKLKFDKAGIDHKNIEWTEWWESAYNKAANNIVVESQAHGVSISVSNKSAAEESLKDDSNGKKSKYMRKYKYFQKTSTLINGNLIKEDNSNLPEVEKTEKDVTRVPLTDEELFKVCGGRTGHKGARHGLTLNGKLQRIAQQDLLSANTCTSDTLQRHNNKCREYRYETDNNENALLPVAPSSEEESNVPKVSKTARKRNRKRINDLTHKLNILCNVSDNDEKNSCALKETEIKLKKRRKKKREESTSTRDAERFRKEEEDKAIDCIPLPVGRKLERKIKEESGQGQITDHNGEKFENGLRCRKKKKRSKRKKDHDYQNGDTVTVQEDDFISTPTKKLKKSHKSDPNVQDFIKNDDTNVLDDKHCCTESPIDSHKIRIAIEHSESSDTHFSEKTDRLNVRIAKKKRAKHKRKQKARLDEITASLEAVHFDAKKSIGNKNSKINISAVMEKIMESDIAVNGTESLKKLVKRKEKEVIKINDGSKVCITVMT